ncbi:hypothetical protein V6N11_061770 [Hibiscus sabdariffa]|uniref:Uncharacterized protein n=2 Tax=Hibiscus sabdariffa TaxID=183260 RepID=A0ABR1ZRB5_9ROSI
MENSMFYFWIIIDNNSFPRLVSGVNEVFKSSRNARIQSLEAKAPKSIVCEGNGAKRCRQCKGTGVNPSLQL